MSEVPIIPLKQKRITIGEQSFIAVLLPNGQAGLVFSELCEWLGLKATDQGQRLRAHATLSTALVLTLIQTPGGPQAANVIEAWGLPLWLARIRPGARPPVYRERLLVLLRDAYVTLSRQLFQDSTEEPPPPKRKKPSKSLEKSSSVLDALQSVNQAVHSLSQAVHSLQGAVAADKQAQEERLRRIEQRQQALEDQIQRSEGRPAPSRAVDPEEELVGSMPLTVEQYYKLVELLQQLSRRSRVPYKVLEMQLSDYCGADRLSAISQAAWPEALAWVTSRLGDY